MLTTLLAGVFPVVAQDAAFDACIAHAIQEMKNQSEYNYADDPNGEDVLPTSVDSFRKIVLTEDLADLVGWDERELLPESNYFYPAVRSAASAYLNTSWNREIWTPPQSLDDLLFLHGAVSGCHKKSESDEVSTVGIVNIRQCPGTTCEIVGKTQPGVLMNVDSVNRDNLGRDWYEIGQEQWVAAWLTEQTREFRNVQTAVRDTPYLSFPGCLAGHSVIDSEDEPTMLYVAKSGDSQIALVKDAVYLEGRYIQLQPIDFEAIENFNNVEGDHFIYSLYDVPDADIVYVALAKHGYSEDLYKLDLRGKGLHMLMVTCN